VNGNYAIESCQHVTRKLAIVRKSRHVDGLGVEEVGDKLRTCHGEVTGKLLSWNKTSTSERICSIPASAEHIRSVP